MYNLVFQPVVITTIGSITITSNLTTKTTSTKSTTTTTTKYTTTTQISSTTSSSEWNIFRSNQLGKHKPKEFFKCRTKITNQEYQVKHGEFINLTCSIMNGYLIEMNNLLNNQSVFSVNSYGTKINGRNVGDPKTTENYRLITGFMLYQCRGDGNFYFVNSTCKTKQIKQEIVIFLT